MSSNFVKDAGSILYSYLFFIDILCVYTESRALQYVVYHSDGSAGCDSQPEALHIIILHCLIHNFLPSVSRR